MVKFVDDVVEEEFVEKQLSRKRPYSQAEYARVTVWARLRARIRPVHFHFFPLLVRGLDTILSFLPEELAQHIRMDLQSAWRSYCRGELSMARLVLRVASVPRHVWRGTPVP